ncbi:hypothetical protein BDV11DRAFT_210675 [Aspergillus similis]
MTSLVLDNYTIAWICALPLKAAAARAMLDRTHPLPQGITDPNAYELGELNGHHIVLAYLPSGVYGTTSAAVVVSCMRRTFPQLQFRLMVGIGGSNVVVSKPGVKHGGVIQYNYGKTVQGGKFKQTGVLNQLPQVLLIQNSSLLEIVSKVLEQYPEIREQFLPPEEHTDILFNLTYYHINKKSDCRNYCLACKQGILCFEIKAAGIMNKLPILIVRGICNYCNFYKQKQ